MDAICEECLHFVYDDQWDCYDCEMELDEDELGHFYSSGGRQCPFYCFGNEYRIVKKQM